MQLVTTAQAQHTVLRQVADKVTLPLDQSTQQLAQDMLSLVQSIDTEWGGPAGMAAPQLGISLQIVYIQVPEIAKKRREYVFDLIAPTLIFNPTYQPIVAEGMLKDWEACYSVPDQAGEVPRYFAVNYTWYTAEGECVTGVARGYFARLLQHEIDHLNGILYVDRMTEDCQMRTMQEYRTAAKEKAENS